MSNAPVSRATASEVREFVAALLVEGKVSLSEAAQRNLNSRGRLHPEVRKAHDSRVSPARRYVEGTEKVVPLAYHKVTKSGRRRNVRNVTEADLRVLAREGGAQVGARGPLGKTAMEAASAALTARVAAEASA